MKHLRWDPSGRTFQFTDGLGQVVPNKFVYKSYIGQKNVFHNGEWHPYIWDKEKRILYYGDAEIRFTDTQVEYWHDGKKLLANSCHPEIEETGIWNRKDATVSGLRITEIPNEYDAIEKIRVSYDVETPDQKATVEIRVGGNNRARLSFVRDFKQSGKQRLTLSYDRLGKEIPYGKEHGKVPLPTEIHRYDFGGGIWQWRSTEEDHVVDQKVDYTEIQLREGDYQADDHDVITPDTFGPSETSDDCYCWEGYYQDYYNDNGDRVLYIGKWTGEVSHIGWIFSNVTVPAGATCEDGCKITIGVQESTGTIQAYLAASQEDSPVTPWSSSWCPEDVTEHATTITWNESQEGSGIDSPECKTLFQQRISDASWGSGDSMAITYMDNGSANNVMLDIYAEEDSDDPGAQITIVYSTGAADLSHLNGIALSSLSHLNGVALSSLSHWNGLSLS